MHRIDSPGSTQDNRFTEGNPSTGVPATEVAADWLNAVQEEIAAVIEAAGIELAGSGDDPQNQLLAALGGLAPAQNIAVFDTPGVHEWTVPDVLRQGLRKAHVTVIGGGAGGSQGNPESIPGSAGGGGGGGGGVSMGIVDLNDQNLISISVGDGGEGGNPTGETGGSSSFGAFLSATGGASTFEGFGGGPGGLGHGGDVTTSLGDGSPGGGGDGVMFSGTGGGPGGRGRRLISTGAGADARGAGGGGGGGILAPGGKGAPGIVIVRW